MFVRDYERFFHKFVDCNIILGIVLLFPVEQAIYNARLEESVVFFLSIISLRAGLLIKDQISSSIFS